MSSFTKPLTTTYLGRGNRKVAHDFAYHVGDKDSKEFIHIPKGFVTDFASVPWPASMLIPKDGDFNQAAVVHDYLYSMLGELPNKTYTRAECDKIFLDAMKFLKVNWFKRGMMYRAVRMGGGLCWNGKKSRLEKEKRKNEKDNK